MEKVVIINLHKSLFSDYDLSDTKFYRISAINNIVRHNTNLFVSYGGKFDF